MTELPARERVVVTGLGVVAPNGNTVHEFELALRKGNSKFMRRFRQVEAFLQETGRKFSDTDLDTLDLFWEKAKEQEASR